MGSDTGGHARCWANTVTTASRWAPVNGFGVVTGVRGVAGCPRHVWFALGQRVTVVLHQHPMLHLPETPDQPETDERPIPVEQRSAWVRTHSLLAPRVQPHPVTIENVNAPPVRFGGDGQSPSGYARIKRVYTDADSSFPANAHRLTEGQVVRLELHYLTGLDVQLAYGQAWYFDHYTSTEWNKSCHSGRGRIHARRPLRPASTSPVVHRHV